MAEDPRRNRRIFDSHGGTRTGTKNTVARGATHRSGVTIWHHDPTVRLERPETLVFRFLLGMMHIEMRAAYDILEHLTDDQVVQLHALYQGEWWSRDRQLDDVRHMLANTPLLVAMVDRADRQLVGFARVLTDCTYRAILFDLIVHPTRRGEGLGDVLVRTVLDHPRLASVKNFELYCRPDLIPYYNRFGFTDELGDLRLMRFSRGDVAAR